MPSPAVAGSRGPPVTYPAPLCGDPVDALTGPPAAGLRVVGPRAVTL